MENGLQMIALFTLFGISAFTTQKHLKGARRARLGLHPHPVLPNPETEKPTNKIDF
jgi:hypothetical protein